MTSGRMEEYSRAGMAVVMKFYNGSHQPLNKGFLHSPLDIQLIVL